MEEISLDQVILVAALLHICNEDVELTERLVEIAQKYDFAEQMIEQLESTSEEEYNDRLVDLFEEIVRGNDYE